MGNLLYEAESFAIRGACYEVHNEKGSGFFESVYQECLEKEMRLQGIPFRAQPELRLEYKGEVLEQKYKPDLICYEKIIVELKIVEFLTDKHRGQVMNYLKATGMKLVFFDEFCGAPKSRNYSNRVVGNPLIAVANDTSVGFPGYTPRFVHAMELKRSSSVITES